MIWQGRSNHRRTYGHCGHIPAIKETAYCGVLRMSECAVTQVIPGDGLMYTMIGLHHD